MSQAQKTDLEDVKQNVIEAKWPKTLTELAEILENELIKQGEKHIPPATRAQKLAFALGVYLGGKSIYIPSGQILKKAIRDLEIYRAFDGQNIAELTRRYQLSEGHVYGIIREQRKLQKQANDEKYQS